MAKFFNCSRVPLVANEALQCHGGNGFIEENQIARLFRESPLNSVWEGTANMMCMDVRRAMQRDPNSRQAVLAELADVRGEDARFDAFVGELDPLLGAMLDDEFYARAASEAIGRAIEGAELLRHSTPEVIDVFMKTRLGGQRALFGSLGPGVTQQQADRIVQRAHVVR
jgi:putative acyl-CoA dehydrogenase